MSCFTLHRLGDIIKDQLRNKLMLRTAGINQVCAAHQCGYGQCSDNGPLSGGIYPGHERGVKEVANAFDIELTDQDIRQWIRLVNGLGKQTDAEHGPGHHQTSENGISVILRNHPSSCQRKKDRSPRFDTLIYEQITKLEDSFV